MSKDAGGRARLGHWLQKALEVSELPAGAIPTSARTRALKGGEHSCHLCSTLGPQGLEARCCPQLALWVCFQPRKAPNYRGSSSDRHDTSQQGMWAGWNAKKKTGRQENRDRGNRNSTGRGQIPEVGEGEPRGALDLFRECLS